MHLVPPFLGQLITLVSVVLSKLRAKLGLKPLEVNAIKKGECGAECGGREGIWGQEQGHQEGFLKKVGLECKSAPLSGPTCVLAAGPGLPCCCDGVWELAGSLSSSSRHGSLSLAAR